METTISNQVSARTDTKLRGEPPHPAKPLFAPVVLITCWAIFVFLVQEYTTGSNYPLPMVKTVGSRIVRFSLDLLACGAIVFLVRGWAIYLMLFAGALGSLVLIVFFEYYEKALSWTIMANHFSEGLAVIPHGFQLLRWASFLPVGFAFAGLVMLARRANRSPLERRRRFRLGLGCLMGWLIVALISTQFIDRVAKLKSFGSMGRLAMTHGYALTWLSEWWYLDEAALLARAQQAAMIKQDRLSPVEAKITPGEKVVIIQVESLDYDVLHVDVNGEPVLPFLRSLLDRSMVFRIAAIHRSGSCDADFVMLMNLNPAGDVTPYKVPGFDWSRSLPAHVRKVGYRSVFLHGNDEGFFNRGSGVHHMEFDRVLFRGVLEEEFHLSSKHWGINDGDVFAVSRDLLMGEPGRALHFIITLTSHGPYHFVDREDWELFEEPTSEREHYLNSMRYVDTQLQHYAMALPDGTMIVLYGDHTSRVNYGQPSPPTGIELVPFVIHKIGDDLSGLQRTRSSDMATSGELTMLDAAGYVWSLFNEIPANN
jgi:phosphoglycerol transferase MdoB-like AlkP superfamily enzyme